MFHVAVIDQMWWWALVGNRRLIRGCYFIHKNWLNTCVCFEQCCVLWTSFAGRRGLVRFCLGFSDLSATVWFGNGCVLTWLQNCRQEHKLDREIQKKMETWKNILSVEFPDLFLHRVSVCTVCPFCFSITCDVCTYMDLNNSWMCHARLFHCVNANPRSVVNVSRFQESDCSPALNITHDYKENQNMVFAYVLFWSGWKKYSHFGTRGRNHKSRVTQREQSEQSEKHGCAAQLVRRQAQHTVE